MTVGALVSCGDSQVNQLPLASALVSTHVVLYLRAWVQSTVSAGKATLDENVVTNNVRTAKQSLWLTIRSAAERCCTRKTSKWKQYSNITILCRSLPHELSFTWRRAFSISYCILWRSIVKGNICIHFSTAHAYEKFTKLRYITWILEILDALLCYCCQGRHNNTTHPKSSTM